MKHQFTYPAPTPVLDVTPRAARIAAHERLGKRVRGAAQAVPEFNPRLLQNAELVEDFIFVAQSFERTLALDPEGMDRLDLPKSPDLDGITTLITRIAAVPVFGWMLRDPLPLQEKVEVPVWAADGSTLRNPFLVELDDDIEAVMDRQFLTQEKPALAKYLQKQATGGPTFREHFQAIEDLRLARDAREYTGPNPHVPLAPGSSDWGGTEIGRSEAIAKVYNANRILSAQLESEAKYGHWNPFREPGNLTTQMSCYKSDIAVAFVLQVAGTFASMQTFAEERELEAADVARRAVAAHQKAQRTAEILRARTQG